MHASCDPLAFEYYDDDMIRYRWCAVVVNAHVCLYIAVAVFFSGRDSSETEM